MICEGVRSGTATAPYCGLASRGKILRSAPSTALRTAVRMTLEVVLYLYRLAVICEGVRSGAATAPYCGLAGRGKILRFVQDDTSAVFRMTLTDG
ncbi:MAG TPA: hypothetical protein VGK34_04050 [Armatimonadota bacterium]